MQMKSDAGIRHRLPPPGGCFTFSIPLSMNPTSGLGPNDLGLIFLLSPVFLALLEPNTPRGPTAFFASSLGLLSFFAPLFFFAVVVVVPGDDDDDDDDPTTPLSLSSIFLLSSLLVAFCLIPTSILVGIFCLFAVRPVNFSYSAFSWFFLIAPVNPPAPNL